MLLSVYEPAVRRAKMGYRPEQKRLVVYREPISAFDGILQCECLLFWKER